MTLALLVLLGCTGGTVDDDDDAVTGHTGTDGGHDGGGSTPSCPLVQLDPALLPAVEGACREPELVTVVFHADGDTFVVEPYGGGASETIRFIGVDTPETGYGSTEEECYGAEASAFTAAAFPLDSCLWLTFDRDCIDPYDRTLAYLHSGSGEQDFFQRQLLHGGYASVLIYSPNDAYEAQFEADEAAARAAGAGLWGECGGND